MTFDKTAKPCRMLAPLFLLIACSSLSGQTIISDSTYNLANWSVQVVTAFGASETHQQLLTGGNSGAFRFMEHILPAPPGPNELALVEVTHIYNGDAFLAIGDSIDHIDYAEDIKLFNLPWNQAFIRSFPAIRQSGKLYRANVFQQVVADTLWRRGSLTGLKANDFIALDGSGDKPDFSDRGDFLFFGFWRVSTRSATQPPIPPNQNLVYQHGSDNFNVTIHNVPSPNQPPIARSDDFLYLDYFFNSNKTLRVLQNDSDPEGDPIRVLSVGEPAFGGTIESFNDTSITYSIASPVSANLESDFFLYKITDGLNPSLDAFVTMHFCVCPIECLSLFLTPAQRAFRMSTTGIGGIAAAIDTLDLGLFRRFRDEVLLPTESGARFVDLYYHNAPEVMPLLIFERRDIGRQAVAGLTMMQGPLRNLLEGDGGEVITQALVDTITVFLDSLISAASDSLRDSLNVELARLGPLQDLVGLPVAEAVEKALGTPTHVDAPGIVTPKDFVLQQNYPNPFRSGATSRSTGNSSTQINYVLPHAAHVTLSIYSIEGRKIKTLVEEFQSAGEKSVVWNGTDNREREMSSGIYFYRLSAGAFQKTKKMILMRDSFRRQTW